MVDFPGTYGRGDRLMNYVGFRSRRSLTGMACVSMLALAASCSSSTSGAGAAATSATSLTTASATTAKVADAVIEGKVRATRALFAGADPAGPGCSVAVRVGDDVVFAEAYGLASIETGTPITTKTVMDIASTSKQFTATAILLLVNEGKVDLEADVRTYIPQLPKYPKTVRVRDLMHHQSGLTDYTDLLTKPLSERTTPADALAALVADNKLSFDPGTEFEYNNSNYFLMSLIVQRVTGATLDIFLRDRVFVPLGLSMVMDPVGAIAQKAESYTGSRGAWTNAVSRWEQLGDGGIQTTPTELVKWASEYWSPQLVGGAIAPRRLENAVADTGAEYAIYGAGITQISAVGKPVRLSHEGAWAGFVTVFDVIPSTKTAVAASCNSSTETGPDFSDKVLDSLGEIWTS